MTDKDKLKPCPFCGDRDSLLPVALSKYRGEIYYVRCMNIGCGIQPKTVPFLTDKEAIEAWNTRASEYHAKKKKR